ncbi:MAG: helix-turn-helix domain-containing protein [Thermincola sp.]|nr:helix-turn-helix domain-containing protein [Thermincola sp.]
MVYKKTAQTLHVHLGTVKYRLRRIREILDVDFNEAETVFNLQVALRVKRLIGKLVKFSVDYFQKTLR